MQPTILFTRCAVVLAGLICALSASAESMPQPPALTPSAFALEVARAVAVSGNGHTEATLGDYIRRPPFRAWWFSDGLFIVKTHPQFKHLLGAQIQKIGDLPVEQALTKVTPFLSGTDLWRRTLSPTLLTSPDVLHHVGLATDANEARFTVRMASGKVQTIKVATQPGRDPNAGGYWKDLIPADSDQAERWPHVLDAVAKRSPIYKAPADVAVEWLGANNQVIYLRSNQVHSERSVLVGEHMGDSDQFWAEGQSMTLPNSKLAVRASNGYHDWGRGCHDRDKCYWLSYVFAVQDISLEPQVPVTTSFEDYAAGRDPVLEAALALAE